MVRDGLKFLTLTAVSVLLSGLTTLLFRSFEARREQLALQWARTGQEAMRKGDSKQAVTALRLSLSYHPDDYENQLTLAAALAAGGHTNEAENYFLNLLQARPGDGPINLQLARLERSRGRGEEAVDYYRAAVFGTWLGDAPVRRRDTRLELSRYLVERGEPLAARAELLIASGNNPDPATQLRIAEMLEAAGDPRSALNAYQHAESGAQASTAQALAGELCYRAGDYACAEEALAKALRAGSWTEEQKIRLRQLEANALKLQQIAFSPSMPPSLRSAHLLSDLGVVQARLKTCTAPSMQSFETRWKTLDTPHNRGALRHDEELQTEYGALIFETESAAATACGAPTGDDALLLHLQEHPMIHLGAQ
jgi:tetratricopeptide (TPR) repeat protein